MNQTFNARSTAGEVLAGICLKGKRFLVTGAASGMGLGTAQAGGSPALVALDLSLP